MARRLTTPVELSAGGERWIIAFTHRALLDIESMTGLDAMQINLSRLSARLLRAVLAAALREAGYPCALSEAGRMLAPAALPVVRKTLIEAWLASMPAPGPGIPDEEPDAEAATEPPVRLSTLTAWARARYILRLSDEDWLGMTPRMVHALNQQRLEDMQWQELMMGVLCAHTVNHSFRAPKDPRLPYSYMIHRFPEPPARTLCGEEIMNVFATLPNPKQRLN